MVHTHEPTNTEVERTMKLTVTINDIRHIIGTQEDPKFIEQWLIQVDMTEYVVSMSLKGSKRGDAYESETVVSSMYRKDGVWNLMIQKSFPVHIHGWDGYKAVSKLLDNLYPDWDNERDVWSISRITYNMTRK